jgi:hypothetical protein
MVYSVVKQQNRALERSMAFLGIIMINAIFKSGEETVLEISCKEELLPIVGESVQIDDNEHRVITRTFCFDLDCVIFTVQPPPPVE